MWHIHFTSTERLNKREVQKLIICLDKFIYLVRAENFSKTQILIQRLRTGRQATSQLKDDNRYDWMTRLNRVSRAKFLRLAEK